MKPEVLAFIPARGGSKGIPKKNIRMINGAPLIAYTISIALKCRNITRVLVSTDDPEIAAVAREYGAEVPFMRPKDIADDHATVDSAKTHALDMLRKQGVVPDYVATMYPTSLFRTTGLIEHLVDKGLEHNCRVITVKQVTPHTRNMMLRHDNALKPFPPANATSGAIAHRSYGIFSGIGNNSTSRIYVHELSNPSHFIDIDTPEDMQLAEEVLRRGMFPIDTPVSQIADKQVSL